MKKHLACLIQGILGLAPNGFSATISVDDGAVVVAEDGLCSLAEAIVNANNDSQNSGDVGECAAGDGDDVIVLAEQGAYSTQDTLPSVVSGITIEGQDSVLEPYRGIALEPGARLVINDLTIRAEPFTTYDAALVNPAGSTVITNNTSFTGFSGGAIRNTGDMTLANTVVSDNFGIFLAGGIVNDGTLSLIDSTVASNGTVLYEGQGGLVNHSTGSILIVRSTFTSNFTGEYRGGGAIANNGGTVTIRDSTFDRNSAFIFGGAIDNFGELTVTNSTFSGNLSHNYDGGAIFSGGTLTIVHSTFAGNTARRRGAAIANVGTLHFSNSILNANGPTVECDNRGTIETNIANWVSDDSCGAAFAGEVQLGPLANHGGNTQTHSLLPWSGAIDVADNAACPEYDQRGVARDPGSCDLGAFEFVDVMMSSSFESSIAGGSNHTATTITTRSDSD